MLEPRWCTLCAYQIIAVAFIQGEKPDGTITSYHIKCFYDWQESEHHELPCRITKSWLQSLPDNELYAVVRKLSIDSGNYQSYADARRLSDRWQRAYDEEVRRRERRERRG
jgi:hypothetical protein